MAAFDRWGGSWGTSWGLSWTREAAVVAPPASIRPGLSPWVDFDQSESEDSRRARVRREREKLGIVAPQPEEETARAAAETQAEAATEVTPPAAVRSGSATPRVVSLDAFKALREAEALAREALDAEAKAYSLARSREIQRRVALLLLASEA